ncbi:MAG TPA: MFS transporter [Gammaproteobacteria bacterium]|nr:MFS transporter [Gammaproteobacteria bacterium]
MKPSDPSKTEALHLRWWQVLYRYSPFDAGDSGWSLIMVSTYFAAYLQAVHGTPASHFGWTISAGALVIAVASPLLGAVADRRGRRQPYLRIAVIGVVAGTAGLAWAPSAAIALLLFLLAYICANAAYTFFLAMIPAVTDKRDVYRVVSMTVGIGYAGSLVCMLTLSRLVPSNALAGRVFLPMALIYLLLALPAMFWAPDFPAKSPEPLNIGAAYRQIRQTLANASRYRPLFRFLLGNFLCQNAIASVVTLMGLYSRNVMGFQASELASLFAPAIVVAMLSAWFVFGPLVRLLGPKRSVLLALLLWLLLFAAIALIRPGVVFTAATLQLDAKALFGLIVAPLAGLGLAGIWSSSQVLFTALTPAEKSGEFWGLYNLSSRTASVLGDATWSAILSLFGEQLFGYQVAVAALAAYVLLGAMLITTVPNVRPSDLNFIRSA